MPAEPEPPASSSASSRPEPAAQASVPPRPEAGHTPNPKSLFARLLAYRLLLLLALGLLALDQASKFWIATRLDFATYPGSPDAVAVIPGFFYLVHVGNTGAAWSNFAGHSSWLAGLALATLAAIFIWRGALGLRQRPVQVAFGLLCGGIAGNLLDRLTHGHVVDFIDLHFGPHFPAMFNPYPTFNLADSGICVGTLLYIVQSLRTPQEAQISKPKQPNAK